MGEVVTLVFSWTEIHVDIKATLPLKILFHFMKDIIVKTLHLKFHPKIPGRSRDICNFISDFYGHEIQ